MSVSVHFTGGFGGGMDFVDDNMVSSLAYYIDSFKLDMSGGNRWYKQVDNRIDYQSKGSKIDPLFL